MGEVISFDFSKRKPVKSNDSPSNVEGSPITEIDSVRKIQPPQQQVVESELDLELRYFNLTLLGGIKELMRLRVSPTSLHQSREVVKGYTTEELFGWLESTTESDWKKRAAFFQSVYRELKTRVG